MHDLHTRLNNLLENGSGRCRDGAEGVDWTEWTPSVNISENDKEYIVCADLPGLTKRDVVVTFENSVLKMFGERKRRNDEKGVRYHRFECYYGKFARSFTLPGDADPHRIRADFCDGVLSVHVVKSKSAKPKQIAVA